MLSEQTRAEQSRCVIDRVPGPVGWGRGGAVQQWEGWMMHFMFKTPLLHLWNVGHLFQILSTGILFVRWVFTRKPKYKAGKMGATLVAPGMGLLQPHPLGLQDRVGIPYGWALFENHCLNGFQTMNSQLLDAMISNWLDVCERQEKNHSQYCTLFNLKGSLKQGMFEAGNQSLMRAYC